MKNAIAAAGILGMMLVFTLVFTGCPNPAGGDPNPNPGPGGTGGSGEVTYISYDDSGNRYTLKVTQNLSKAVYTSISHVAQNLSRAAYTPESGDTYTLTVEGFNSGTSTGTVTSFSSGSYTLSNNGTALSLGVSGEVISSIPAPIIYDGGGNRVPDGLLAAYSPLFGTWGDGAPYSLTINAAGGWTFSSAGGMTPAYNYSGTYTIADTAAGIPHYLLYPGDPDNRASIVCTGYENTFPVVNKTKIDFVFTKENVTAMELTKQTGSSTIEQTLQGTWKYAEGIWITFNGNRYTNEGGTLGPQADKTYTVDTTSNPVTITFEIESSTATKSRTLNLEVLTEPLRIRLYDQYSTFTYTKQ